MRPYGKVGGVRLKDLQDNWNRMAKEDPFWAVSTAPRYKGGKWEPEAFFETGRAQVEAVLSHAAQLGLHIAIGQALDFGSGLGRLTQALADHFDEVVGVDIAPAMVEQAAAWNKHGERVRYLLNDSDDLSLLPSESFDLVISEITLMHMRTDYSKSYIVEFLRVLRPGGVAIFQIPDPTVKQRIRALIPRSVLEPALRFRARKRPRMEIYGMRTTDVERLALGSGGRSIHAERIDEGHSGNRRYYVAV